MTTLSIGFPDDFHIHLRDGAALANTVPHAAQSVQRALVMPNLVPPVLDVQSAEQYRDRIMAHVPKNNPFEPLMSLYLTDATTPKQIEDAANSSSVFAVKLYPANATTNSAQGVSDLAKLTSVFAELERTQLPLLIHGEVTDPDVDVFDREQVFIERHLIPLLQRYPKLRVVLEHITTDFATQFVANSSYHLAATITAHHLLINRNDLLVGGIRPHNYCLPIVKRKQSQLALIKAAISGNPKFFLGSDSAPHAIERKESACGCAGIYTANALLSYYLQIFEMEGALDKFEGFASHFGADFYGLPRNDAQLTLIRAPWQLPDALPYQDSTIIPFLAGSTLNWVIKERIG